MPFPTQLPTVVPISADSIPLVKDVEARNITDSTVSIVVVTGSSAHGGILFCAVFSAPSQYVSNFNIREQGKYVAIGVRLSTSAIVFDGLRALSTYYAYCYTEGILGESSSYEESFNKGVQFVSECCHKVEFSATPSTVFADVKQYSTLSLSSLSFYEIKFHLAAKPHADVTARVVFYDDNMKSSIQSGVFATPDEFAFHENSTSLSRSFLAHGMEGSFYVSIELEGEGADNFSDIPAHTLELVGTASSPPLPFLTSAEFDYSGQRLIVAVQALTDIAFGVTDGIAVWRCELVLSFSGASTSGCTWMSSTEVMVSLNYYAVASYNLVVGDAVHLLPGVLGGFCYTDACPTSFADSSSVIVSVVSDFIQPTVIIKMPSEVGSCEPLQIDPTQSTGNAGREWSHMEWIVSADDGSDTSVIKAILDSHTNTTYVITIDADLLSNTTYTIGLGLKNFLQDATAAPIFAAGRIEVTSRNSSMFSQVTGSSYESHLRSKLLTRTVSSSMVTCFEGIMNFVSPDVSVEWVVYEVNATKHLKVVPIFSESNNPSIFRASPYTFTVGSTYQITAISTAKWESTETSETSSFLVYIKRGTVSALINGYKNSSVQHQRNSLLVLDGSDSADADDLEAPLHYQWNCKNLSLDNFGQDCFSSKSANELSAPILTFPAYSLNDNDHLQVSLTVESTISGLVRTNVAKVIVVIVSRSDLDISLAILPWKGVYSPQSDFIIDSLIKSNASGGVTATWSLQSASDVNISSPFSQLAPITRSFSSDETANSIIFPLGIGSNVLTGDVEYIFRLRVEDEVGNALYRELSVVPNAPPVGGHFKVRPTSGNGFITNFKFSALDWGDSADDYPIVYLFAYQIAASFDPSVTYDQVAVRSTIFTFSTLLPGGLSTSNGTVSCAVLISDYWGATNMRVTSVVVTEGDILSEYGSILSSQLMHENSFNSLHSRTLYANEVNAYIASNIIPHFADMFSDAANALQSSKMLTSLLTSVRLLGSLNHVNCSLSPKCASLNRRECSEVSHTCGECLPGFEGVFGHSNFLCQDSGIKFGLIGSNCTVDTECATSNCEDGCCKVPVKRCPMGNMNGVECSGNGTCTHLNYHGEVVSNECREDDTFCIASCQCNTGYGGNDCGIVDSYVAELDAIRGLLCSNLVIYMSYLDPSEDSLLSISSILDKAFAYDAVYTSSSMVSCVTALDGLDEMLVGVGNLTLQSATRKIIVNVVSDFVDSPMYLSASAQVESIVDHLATNILNNMIQGPTFYTLSAANLQLGFQHELLSLLAGNSLSIPLSPEEEYYEASFTNLGFPLTGLLSCSGFNNYAKIATVTWGYNPHTRDSALSSKFFRVLTLSTSDVGRNDVFDEFSTFELTLPLVSVKNWTVQEPSCVEYSTLDGGTIVDCEYCNVSSQTAYNVSIICSNVADVFCPSGHSASSANSKPYFVIQSTDSTIVELSNSFTLKTKDSFQFMLSIIIIQVLVLIFLFCLYRWDKSDQESFVVAATDFAENKTGIYEIEWAFDERGFAPDSTEVNHDSDEIDGRDDVDFAYSLPSTSLLSEGASLWERTLRAMCRHHRWIRIFTFPSIQKTRVTRMLVAGTDMLCFLFASAVFHGIFYPDDNQCEMLQSEEECLDLVSQYSGSQQCTFSDVDGCTLKAPPRNVQFLALISLLIILITLIPRRLLQLLLEKVCNKRPILDDASILSNSLKEEPPVAESEAKWAVDRKKIVGASTSTPVSLTPTVSGDTSDDQSIHIRRPYFLNYCDSIVVEDEVRIVLESVKSYFNDVLAKTTFPWRAVHQQVNFELETSRTTESSDILEKKTTFNLGKMGAMMRWLYVASNGTPLPLPWTQKLRYGTPNNRLLTKMRQSRRRAAWVVEKATNDKSIRPGQTEYMNNIVLQHFVMEQISPICRFAIDKDFFNQDNSSCGRIPLLLWLAAWFALCSTWIFMTFWCILWTITNGNASVESLLTVFIISVLVDGVLNDFCQIFLLNVVITEKLRPQLRQIYDVLRNIQLNKSNEEIGTFEQHVCVVQHFSAACRASRVPTLAALQASRILSFVDDCDVALCRRNRISSIGDVGVLGFFTLYLPSCINGAYTIVQQATLDFIFPVFWLCLLILLSFLLWLSIYAVLGFCFLFTLLVIFSFRELFNDSSSEDSTGESTFYDKNALNNFNFEIDGEAEICWDNINNTFRNDDPSQIDVGSCAAFDESFASSSCTIFDTPGNKLGINIQELKYNSAIAAGGKSAVAICENSGESLYKEIDKGISNEEVLQRVVSSTIYRVDSKKELEKSPAEKAFKEFTEAGYHSYEQSKYLSSSDSDSYGNGSDKDDVSFREVAPTPIKKNENLFLTPQSHVSEASSQASLSSLTRTSSLSKMTQLRRRLSSGDIDSRSPLPPQAKSSLNNTISQEDNIDIVDEVDEDDEDDNGEEDNVVIEGDNAPAERVVRNPVSPRKVVKLNSDQFSL